MATKVYLSGKSIIADKDGEPSLTIRTDRAEYVVFYPLLSSDGVTPPTPEDIQFKDIFYGTSITDKIENITNGTGGSYASLAELQVYLSSFFQRARGETVIQQGATRENQTTIINQNEDVKSSLGLIKDDTEVLEKIKEESKTNNHILRKIYNHE